MIIVDWSESHAVIYVVDSGDRERVEESKAAFDRMIKNENIRGIPLLVAANKQDLADCMGVREVKHLFENNAEARDRSETKLILFSFVFRSWKAESWWPLLLVVWREMELRRGLNGWQMLSQGTVLSDLLMRRQDSPVLSDLSVVMRNSVVRPPFYHE